MRRGKLGCRVLTPNAGGVKNYMKRLDNRISRCDASLCRRAGFNIDSTACIDGRDKRLRPPGRPARRQSTAGVSGTRHQLPPSPAPKLGKARIRSQSSSRDAQIQDNKAEAILCGSCFLGGREHYGEAAKVKLLLPTSRTRIAPFDVNSPGRASFSICSDALVESRFISHSLPIRLADTLRSLPAREQHHRCQLPAARPAPPVHPRKGAGYDKNSSMEAKI